MGVKLKDEFVQDQKQWIKRAMRGRPLYFGLQAPAAKSGKFLVSKKPGDVKASKVLHLEPYEGSGKDQKKAEEKNRVSGGPTSGVCQGENGTLKLYFEQREPPPAAEKFVRHFIAREIKFKAVKRVTIVEAQPPEVLADDPHDKPASKDELERSYGELSTQVGELAGSVQKQLQELLKSVRRHIDSGKLDEADTDLLALKATLHLIQRLNEATRRLVALRDDLKTAGQTGTQFNEQDRIEDLVRKAHEKLSAAARALAATDEDVEAAAEDDLQAGENLLEKAETLKPTLGTYEDEDTGHAVFYRDWLEQIRPDLRRLKQAKVPDYEEIAGHVKAVAQAVPKKNWESAAASYKLANELITAAREQLPPGGETELDRQKRVEGQLEEGKGQWFEKFEGLIHRDEAEEDDPPGGGFFVKRDKKRTDAPLGWGDGTVLPGAPRLTGLKTTIPEKFNEGEGVINLIENDEGRRMIAKIDHTESYGRGSQELAVYQHVYETVGHHPNLGRVHGLGVVQHGQLKLPALIMDEVVGDPGDKMLQKLSQSWKQGRMSTEEFWGSIQFLGRRLLEVIRHLHDAGISHNDIKPPNFIVDGTTGEPVLIDLGLHSVLGYLGQGGTEGYTAPQVQNEGVTTETTDVYSIGRILQRGLGGLVGEGNLPTEVVTCLESMAAGLTGELTPEQAAGLDFFSDNLLDDETARKILARVVSNDAPLSQDRVITVSDEAARNLCDEWNHRVEAGVEIKTELIGARARVRLEWLQKAETLLTRAKEEGVDGPRWTSLRECVDRCLKKMDRAAREHQEPVKPVKWTPDWRLPVDKFTLDQAPALVQQVIDAGTRLLDGDVYVSALHEILSLHERGDVLIRSLRAYVNVLVPPRLPKEKELKQLRKKGKPVPSMEDLDLLAEAREKFIQQLARLEPLVARLADQGAKLGVTLATAPAELQKLLDVDWYDEVSAADSRFRDVNPVVFSTLDETREQRVQEFLQSAREAWQVIGPRKRTLRKWLDKAVQWSRELGRGLLLYPEATERRDELYARISVVARALSIERDWIQRPGGQPPPKPEVGPEQRQGTDMEVLGDLRSQIEAASVAQELNLQERISNLESLGTDLDGYADVEDPEAARLYKSTRALWERCLERVRQQREVSLKGAKKLLAETTPDHVWRTLNSIRVHLEHPGGLDSPNVQWFRRELEAIARLAAQVRQFQSLVGDALDDEEHKQLLKILEAMDGYDELERRFELLDRSKPVIQESTEQRSELSQAMDALMKRLEQAASAPWPEETQKSRVQKRLSAVRKLKKQVEQLEDPVRESGIAADIEQFEFLVGVRDQMEKVLNERL